MRARGIAGIAGAALLALTAWSPVAAGPGDVEITLFQFKPEQLEVPAGTVVTWTNHDDIEHTVTSGEPERRDGRFNTPLNGKDARGTVTFTQPGVYPYFCDRHQSMRGEIRVR